MSKTLQLLILSDGKPGHRNQSLGLADALARRTNTQCRVIELNEVPRGKKILHARKLAFQGPKPDWIIAAGHGTHLCALLLRWWLSARAIVLMKPSWPMSCFDACLVPTHDLIGKPIPAHVIPTTGALNRIVSSHQKEPKGLILIGGESREFSFDPVVLREAITTVIAQSSLEWHITDSRRSPAGFLDSLSHLSATLHPHQQTTTDWLPEQLRIGQCAWVTNDSVSMIYEALSSGAQVGLLPMPARKPSSKIVNAVAELCREGKLTTYKDLQATGRLLASPPLAEADRCAEILLAKFFNRST